jgi:pimeloyl-ACP methyl ester carboxylesterase
LDFCLINVFLTFSTTNMVQNFEIAFKTGKAKANGIEIYYESFGNDEDQAIVLIMGLDAQCLIWSKYFIEPLVYNGYRVIRFDNRDIGLSTWIDDWHRSKPYTLEDMAKDTVELLDFLGIEKAHFIGASMGGMITQRLAISHAKRVITATFIMSSAYSLDPDAATTIAQKLFLKAAPKLIKWMALPNKWTSHKVTVPTYLATYKFLSGTKYNFDKEYFTELFTYLIEERKGQNPHARYRQLCAVIASGSRLNELEKIECPSLILHGTADKLVPIFHSRKYSKFIKTAKFIELDGIGHEIPRAAIPEVHDYILEHLKKI